MAALFPTNGAPTAADQPDPLVDAEGTAIAQNIAGSASDGSSTETTAPPLPPVNPMTEYGKPFNPKVTWDKLHFYQARDLAAHHMYSKQHSHPIVLFCMSIGVPNCTPPDSLANDDCISNQKKRKKKEKKREEKFAQREACAENQPKEIEKECYSNINFIQ
eukprot:scaffold27061_cov20-Cyclotella_meneghiniana.AAC.1